MGLHLTFRHASTLDDGLTDVSNSFHIQVVNALGIKSVRTVTDLKMSSKAILDLGWYRGFKFLFVEGKWITQCTDIGIFFLLEHYAW